MAQKSSADPTALAMALRCSMARVLIIMTMGWMALACKPEIIEVPDLDLEIAEEVDPEEEAEREAEQERQREEVEARDRMPRFNEAEMIKKLKESGEWIDPKEMVDKPTPVYGERIIPGRMIDPGEPPTIIPAKPAKTEYIWVTPEVDPNRPKYVDEGPRFDRRAVVGGMERTDGVGRTQGYQPKDAARWRTKDNTGATRPAGRSGAPANVASGTPGVPAMPGVPVTRPRPSSKDPRAPVSPRRVGATRPTSGNAPVIKP